MKYQGCRKNFYDLGQILGEGGTSERSERLSFSASLGYTCLAFAHRSQEQLQDHDRNCLAELSHGAAVLDSSQVQQLTRLTLAFEDASSAAHWLGPRAALPVNCDILAIQPLSERVLQQACKSLEVDLISLDLSRRLPFKLQPTLLQLALRRGVHFEVCYGPALQDSTVRRMLFSNAMALSRATRSRGIIMSSGSCSVWEMRAPLDVANLAVLLGMSEQQAKSTVSEHCEAVLAHAGARKAHRNSIIVHPVFTAITDEQAADRLRNPTGKVSTVSIEEASSASALPVDDALPDAKRQRQS